MFIQRMSKQFPVRRFFVEFDFALFDLIARAAATRKLPRPYVDSSLNCFEIFLVEDDFLRHKTAFFCEFTSPRKQLFAGKAFFNKTFDRCYYY